MSHKSLFEYFELSIPHCFTFSYLLNELLPIKIDLIFVELFNLKLWCHKTESVGKNHFSEFISIPKCQKIS